MSEEKRGKNRVATQLDGLPVSAWPSHRIQQLLETNIHPGLTGIRVYPVPLSGSERGAFVVQVPQGRTAYQAKDCRYYGRSEFETKPLRDLDVRLRMERGKAPFADVLAEVRLSKSAEAVLQEQVEEHRKNLTELGQHLASDPRKVPQEAAAMDAALRAMGADKPHLIDLQSLSVRHRFHEYEVEFRLRNGGERTIREFEVQIAAEAANGHGVTAEKPAQPEGGFWNADDITRYRQVQLSVTERDCLAQMPKARLWPGATCKIGRATVLVPEAGSVVSGAVAANWTVFLDDVLPNTGQFDLAEMIRAGT